MTPGENDGPEHVLAVTIRYPPPRKESRATAIVGDDDAL